MIQELDIAIIGMSCRYPGANSVAAFWENLRNGVESITPLTDAELLAAGADPAWLAQPNYVKVGAGVEQAEWFDAHFFGFTPREAKLLDPQHRLFLETAQEALEHAGYNPATYAGAIGVYAGSAISNYLINHRTGRAPIPDHTEDFQRMIANDKDFVPTQVSYRLNLKGPSLNVQTACSTSLVAVHLACQSLLNGECHMALAGGVAIHFPQQQGYFYQEGMIRSPDGHCRAFDAQAQGTVVASGVGIVVLKRAEDAVAAGDMIYALIKGTAINNDGALKVSFTAPSVDGQARVIRDALQVAGVAPETIAYVETHGTGTELGDPIEIAALTQAFQSQQRGFCAIGSVKTNIGHTDIASGVAGLIKTALALHAGVIPPSLHFTAPNPQIDFANSPFYVNTKLTPWPVNGDQPRRAGVSSFGIGGTNAHAILEAVPPQLLAPASPAIRPYQLLVLSAKTPSALARATTKLADHLNHQSALNLADVAYTLQVGRQAHTHRAIVLCADQAQAVTALRTQPTKGYWQGAAPNHTPAVVFLFPGGGAQHLGMGADLYEHEPHFRAIIDHCATWLQPHLGVDIRQLLYHAPEPQAAARTLERATLGLPTLFATEYALARLWMAWGIQPQAMIGHSLGEYVAACLAGVFSLEDALQLVVKRGQLFDELPAGGMLSVALGAAALTPYLDDALSIAAINAPALSVVAGSTAALAALAQRLAADQIEHRQLRIAVAAHSSQLTPILERFQTFVQTISLQTPTIPFISNLTGTWIRPTEATDPAYWAQHLRHTVRFADGIATLLQEAQSIFLELGPGRTLTTLVNQHPARQQQPVMATMRHPQESQSDVEALLLALGKFWVAGGQVDWPQLYADEPRRRLPLPTYPFERQRYWMEPAAHQTPSSTLPVKKPDLADWFYLPSWERVFPPVIEQMTHFAGHKCWLLFLDDCGVGAQLATRLRAAGQTVLTVQPGPGFRQLADGAYTLNPACAAEYETLWATLAAHDQQPQTILHLWRVTATPTSMAATDVTTGLALGFYSLLYLAQALGGSEEPIDLIVVTNHLHDVTGTEPICPERATLLGPVKVIPAEYPNLTCRSVDIELPTATARTTAPLIDQLLAELCLPGTALRAEEQSSLLPTIVAYRGNYRWVQNFRPTRLTENAYPTRVRPKGVYLITGGLGGIGLTLAADLASFQAKLILVSRSAFPARESWSTWVATHGPDDAVSKKINELQAIEAVGAELLILRADVASYVEMQTVVAQGVAVFGPINGVIHAAGVPGGGAIQRKSTADAAAVLAPKVLGTLVLDQLLRATDLDFFVLCSSVTAILSGFGQVDYTAANAFMDAYALSNRTTFTVSINWDAWQEVGMAVNIALPQLMRAARTASLQRGILPPEGQALFRTILTNRAPQVVTSTADLHLTRVPQPDQVADGDATAEQLWAVGQPEMAPPARHSLYVAPQRETEQRIVDIYQAVLGVTQIGIHDDFFALGGHSLTATQVISRLRRVFAVKVAVRVLFDHPTVADLADYIDLRLTAKNGSSHNASAASSSVSQWAEQPVEEGEI